MAQEKEKAPSVASAAAASRAAVDSVTLTEAQQKSVRVETVGMHAFGVQREAVGSISFNLERQVQVFPPYPGRILDVFGRVGDAVPQGRTLYTIDSPDLVQAESTLIAAAGQRELTTQALDRARKVFEAQGLAQKDLQQAVSDQQAAEGAYRAARDALRIFGKTDAEMDQVVAQRRVDSKLVVHSPIAGRITERSAAPGVFVQPGSAPAPFTVADMSSVWMLASVPESDIPLLRLGQQVDVKVMALPNRVFKGTVDTIAAAVDPSTHTIQVRAQVPDPKGELRPQMFARFVIRTGQSQRSAAVAVDGVVREGDGTMSVWVTTDRLRFAKRSVSVGLIQEGFVQILSGVNEGELVATEGALFLSNMLINSAR
jgi:cobalt-zinc-cadmium efflux system membrane fusion protein